MLHDMQAFLDYFAGVRRRTRRFIRAVPPDHIDWALAEGEFTCGDIIRHLAATEQMFVGVVVDERWSYPGHEREHHPTLDAAVNHLNATHETAMQRLQAAGSVVLQQPRPSLQGPETPLPAWQVLLLMVEHEIHHRSQLATYLTLLHIPPPQLYGTGVEDLIAHTQAALTSTSG